jgi:hypothetical protein
MTPKIIKNVFIGNFLLNYIRDNKMLLKKNLRPFNVKF